MKKVLILASVASMIDQFNMPNIYLLIKMGYEVHVAANFKNGNTSSEERLEEFKLELSNSNIPYYHIEISRNILDFRTNLKAYKEIKYLVNTNKYEFIHCHSPIGGVLGRIAGQRLNTPVIYTAHGFHFYKGAPLINWFLFFPIEYFLSKYTYCLITINNEDFNRAKRLLKANNIEYIPGVGVNINKFKNKEVQYDQKRNELNIPLNSFLILSIGELNKNKNHGIVIKAISKIGNTNIQYVICGKGPLEKKLKKLINKLGLDNQVHLLGFREDIDEICKISNLFVLPSKREGLSVALMEAMANGLPVICSNIRGNQDLIVNEKGGYLVKPNDIDSYAKLINDIYVQGGKKFGIHNSEYIKSFDIENVNKKMYEIYKNL